MSSAREDAVRRFCRYGTGVEGMTIQTPDLSGEYLQEM
jgi:hypothetical protein